MRRMNRAVDADHADPATVAREFLAALSQISLKISRRDAEDLSHRRRGPLAETQRISTRISRRERRDSRAGLFLLACALRARSSTVLHEFSAPLREMLSVCARDPPPRTCDG